MYFCPISAHRPGLHKLKPKKRAKRRHVRRGVGVVARTMPGADFVLSSLVLLLSSPILSASSSLFYSHSAFPVSLSHHIPPSLFVSCHIFSMSRLIARIHPSASRVSFPRSPLYLLILASYLSYIYYQPYKYIHDMSMLMIHREYAISDNLSGCTCHLSFPSRSACEELRLGRRPGLKL